MFTRRNQSDSAIGWISTVDSLLLGFGLMLVLALHSAMTRQKAQAELGARDKELQDVQAQEKENQKRIGELEGKGAAGISQELAEALRKLADLEKLKADSDLQIEDIEGKLNTALNQLGEATDAETKGQQERQSLAEKIGQLQDKLDNQEAIRQDSQNLAQEVKDLLAELAAKAREIEDLEKEIEHLREEIRKLMDRIAKAEAEKKAAEDDARQKSSARGQAAATDVLGFQGDFKNVVFIIDISHSMTHIPDPERPGFNNDKYNPARWIKTKREIVSWARNLPMETIRIVLFHSDVFDYPDDGESYPMTGDDREKTVGLITGLLDNVTPDGQTNTLGALEKAYGYPDVDTMVLFTDGNPMVNGRDSRDLIQQVKALVEKNKKIPVNVVGIGEYFEKDFAAFLRFISNTTGGEFIGR